MSYFLLILSSIITFVGTIKNRDIQNVGGIFLFFTMVIIMGFNYANADINNYEYMYNAVDSFFDADLDVTNLSSWLYYFGNIRNFGYFYINLFFSNLGFSFSEFRFISSAFLLAMIFIQVKKLTPNYGLVMLFYFIYPFFFDTIQTRNFYIEVMLLLALFVYSNKEKFCRLKYGIIILAASTVHNIALTYFPSLFIKKILKYHFFRMLIMMIVVTFPILYPALKERTQSIILFIASTSDSFNAYSVYSDWGVGVNAFMHWGMMIFIWLILNYIRKQSLQTSIYIILPIKINQWITTTYLLWTYLLLFIPLLAVVPDAYRISRNVFLPVYICIANYKSYGQKNGIKIVIACLLAVIIYSYCTLPKLNNGSFLGIPIPSTITITQILDNNYMFDVFD